MITESDYGLSPEQYHHCLDILWEALGVTGPQSDDVFTLVADKIKKQQALIEQFREK